MSIVDSAIAIYLTCVMVVLGVLSVFAYRKTYGKNSTAESEEEES